MCDNKIRKLKKLQKKQFFLILKKDLRHFRLSEFYGRNSKIQKILFGTS